MSYLLAFILLFILTTFVSYSLCMFFFFGHSFVYLSSCIFCISCQWLHYYELYGQFVLISYKRGGIKNKIIFANTSGSDKVPNLILLGIRFTYLHIQIRIHAPNIIVTGTYMYPDLSSKYDMNRTLYISGFKRQVWYEPELICIRIQALSMVGTGTYMYPDPSSKYCRNRNLYLSGSKR